MKSVKILGIEKKDDGLLVVYFFRVKIFCIQKKNKITIPNTIIDYEETDVNKKSNYNPLLIKNEELCNTANKNSCYMLATGPSINNQDLTKLAGRDCFSISNFFLHKDIGIIKPKFHFFAPYHEPLILENFIDWLNMADKKLPKETNIILGVADYDKVQKYNLFPNRKIYYLEFVDTWDINTDIKKPVMGPQTGPIMILPVLDYMGYKEINMIGQDMTRLKDYKGTTQNFYTNDPRKNATDGAGWEDIIVELKRTCKMFEQFQAYYNYFISKGIKVFNLSPISWISFIPKKDFNIAMEENIDD